MTGSLRVSGGSVALDDPALRHRNLLCSILFVDMVDYSSYSVDEQVAFKKLLNEGLVRVLCKVVQQAPIFIDTGDGAALCFQGDPGEALNTALCLRASLGRQGESGLAMRMGLNLGPVRMVTDLNNCANVIGDGINVAQRIMDFARPGQVLVSRAYHEVVSRIIEESPRRFRYLGAHRDKHGRIHELHAVVDPQPLLPGGWEEPDGPRANPWAHTPRPPSPEALVALEHALCRQIGPMARLLLRQQLRASAEPEALVRGLCEQIDSPAAREEFRALARRLLRQVP